MRHVQETCTENLDKYTRNVRKFRASIFDAGWMLMQHFWLQFCCGIIHCQLSNPSKRLVIARFWKVAY